MRDKDYNVGELMGLFGVVSQDEDVTEDLFLGTDYHSHRFIEKAGLCTFDPDLGFQDLTDDIVGSQFKTVFFPDYRNLRGKYGIGVISGGDNQPIVFRSHLGDFALCMDGLVSNEEDVLEKMLDQRRVFSRTDSNSLNQVELVANLIGRESTYKDGLLRLHDSIYGSASLLLMSEDGIYAFSDKFPLIVGKKDGSWAVASESTSFPNTGFKIDRFLEPGSITKINENGVHELDKVNGLDICAFLWIYTAFPPSSFSGVNVETTRNKSGEILAKRYPVDADLVGGVPDSGTAHGIGYANKSRIRYGRPLIKYTPGYQRSYTPPLQELRDWIASKKLIPVEELIRGLSLIIVEDSIVRGTQLRNTIHMLWDKGVKEVHGRIACPPLMHPCPYNRSTRKPGELAAIRAIRAIEGNIDPDLTPYLNPGSNQYQRMVDRVRQEIGLTSLAYQTPWDMVDAIGLPREGLCMYCWRGNVSY